MEIEIGPHLAQFMFVLFRELSHATLPTMICDSVSERGVDLAAAEKACVIYRVLSLDIWHERRPSDKRLGQSEKGQRG